MHTPVTGTATPNMIRIGPGIMEPFEVGAHLLAALMYPRRAQLSQRTDAALGLCGGFALEQVRSVPSAVSRMRGNSPHYFKVTPPKARAVRADAIRLLKHRMVAAKMARPFLGQAIYGDAYVPPADVSKLLPSHVAEEVVADLGWKSAENVVQRVWRPSLPVIHLAIGVDQALQRAGVGAEGFGVDLQDMDLFRSIIAWAMLHEPFVRSDARLAIPKDEVLHVRWIE